MRKQPFENEGVVFTFKAEAPHLAAVNLGYPETWHPDSEGIFNPLGYVINFKIVTTNPKIPVSPSDEVTIDIYYKKKHLDSANKNGGLLTLGMKYPDEENWSPIDSFDIEDTSRAFREYHGEWKGKTNYQLPNPTRDPVIAWGP
jgi:hypothetical protein